MSIEGPRERVRRTVHFAFGFAILLLPPLGRIGGACVAGAALLYNAVVAPRAGLDRAYRRADEPVFSGLVTYPLAVFGLLLLCPLPVAAGAWAVLAAADPVAAVVGRRCPRPAVPWHRRKSLAGAAAGALAGAAACLGALAWVGGGDPAHLAGRAGAAAAAGALAETVPWPIDDNLLVAAAAALVLLAWS